MMPTTPQPLDDDESLSSLAAIAMMMQEQAVLLRRQQQQVFPLSAACSSSYQSVVAFNNRGVVSSMKHAAATTTNNDNDNMSSSSLALFQKALDAAAMGLVELSPSSPPQAAAALYYQPPSCAQSCCCNNSLLFDWITPEERRMLENRPMMMESAFIRPMVLLPSETAYSKDPQVNLTVAFYVVAFNIALVYHQEGIRLPERLAQPLLAQAKSLYFMVQGSLMESGMSLCQSSGHEVLDFLNLAIHNNLAQISFVQMEYLQSKYHLQLLERYAATIQPEIHGSDTARILRWYMEKFQSNAELLLQPPTVASAA